MQAGADINKLHAQTSSPAVRRHAHQRTRKNDTIDATQNAPTYHTNKKIVKHKVKTSEEFDNIDSSCTGDESEDERSSISHNDQDSDVSLETDNDEEIDTTEIEEEAWVDCIERSTNEAIEKMGNEKVRCWNKTHKKMKWRLPVRIATSPSESWLIAQNTEPAERLEDQGKDGKMTSTNSSNLLRKRQKT